MIYFIAWWTHVTCVVLSGSFFALRGAWMLMESPLLEAKVVRILPHVIDTCLLGAAIILMYYVGQVPFVDTWLTVKFIALLAYIGFGMFALRRGRTRAIRVACLTAALATFTFMVSVALTRDPMGFLGG